LQGFTSILLAWLISGYPPLVTLLIAVACIQLAKFKAAILDIRQQHIIPHHGEEDEQVHPIANRNIQAKLNVCIQQHHQDIKK
jgi:hypothetical protein